MTAGPTAGTTATGPIAERVRRALRPIPDYPKPGILFQDITPVLGDPALLRDAVEAMAAPFRGQGIRHVVGIEARGFILGAPVALALGTGFVPARKPGKLPWRTVRETYALEYGTDTLEAHADGVAPGDRVLVVDDVLATGGTAAAAAALVRQLGGTVAGVAVLLELGFLAGRGRIEAEAVRSLVVL